MSNKERTRDKLVASLRKTRVTVNEETQSPSATSAAPVEKAPAAPASKPAPRKPAPAMASSSGSDAYQSGRRIWPD